VWQAHLAIEAIERQAEAERQLAKWHAEFAEQAEQTAAGVRAVLGAEPLLDVAEGYMLVDGLRVRAWRAYQGEWCLTVWQPCATCGQPAINCDTVSSLLDLGMWLANWAQDPRLCDVCDAAETERERAVEQVAQEEPTPTPAKPDAFGQLVDLLGEALRERGYLGRRVRGG